MKKLTFIFGLITLFFVQDILAQPTGRRDDVINMSEADMITLSTAMLGYIDESIIEEHSANTEFGDDQLVIGTIHSTEIFLNWHRFYLHEMEEAIKPTLISLGLLNGLLPRWTHADGFGPEPVGMQRMLTFLQIDPDCASADGFTFPGSTCTDTPDGTTANPYPYGASLNCGTLGTFEQFSDDLQFNYHNPGHGALGGIMSSFKSPASPIFWLWHAMIDDVYWDFQQMCKVDGDLYIKDTESPIDDTGIEPNPNTGPMWVSTDIWVRNDQDTPASGVPFLNHGHYNYTNEGNHENPEYKLNDPNYVYVRVRNKSTTDSFAGGKLRVYWSKASTGLNWPTTWEDYYPNAGNPTLLYGDELTPDNPGADPHPVLQTLVLPHIPAGGQYIVEIPWYVPNPADFVADGDEHHFCILARLISAFDEMDTVEGTGIGANVRNNNNIAWKNVSVYDLDPLNIIAGGGGEIKDLRELNFTSVYVTNPYGAPQLTNMEFKTVENEDGRDLYDHNGRAFAKLDKELYTLWRNAGFAGDGFKALGFIGNEYYVLFTKPVAHLNGLKLPAKSNLRLGMGYAPIKRMATGQRFDYDVCQYNGKMRIGGERYDIRVGKQAAPRSNPIASNTLAANILIAPNPASDQFTVSFNVAFDQNVSLQLFDINGRLLQTKDMECNEGNHEQQFQTAQLSSGVYFLKVLMGQNIITQRVVIE